MYVMHGCARKLASICLFILLLSMFGASSASAIPVYALTSASSCDTCHIEPLGWANPDISDRRCTVDCIGCHISPAGGGLRLADGKWHSVLIYRVMGTGSTRKGATEHVKTGLYVEEISSRGLAIPEWHFGD